MEQRTLKIGDRIIYCYEDGSVEFYNISVIQQMRKLIRTTGSITRKGYKKVDLSVNGKKKALMIHRLIALAFHPNPSGLPEIDHINRDRTANRPCNLRWADSRINNSNKVNVEQSLARYGVRSCDNRKAYAREYNKVSLHMITPDGVRTRTRALSQEAYAIIEPLSHKDRYFKYQELREANKL